MRGLLNDVEVPLLITEGAIKADSAASLGLVAISLAGVDGWMRKGAALPAWDDFVPLKGRQVLLAYDSDVTTKASVHAALVRLGNFLRRSGARVEVVRLPPGENRPQAGLDDFLAEHRGSTHPIGLLLEHAVELEDVPEGDGLSAPPEFPKELTGADVLDGLCDFYERYIRFPKQEQAWASGRGPRTRISSSSSSSWRTWRFKRDHEVGEDPPAHTDPLDLRGREERRAAASDSAIFRRLAESPPPTLCFDEVDNYIGEATERRALIGMLNEGFRGRRHRAARRRERRQARRRRLLRLRTEGVHRHWDDPSQNDTRSLHPDPA